MRLDRIQADLGLADAEIGPAAAVALEDAAYGFLAAGGVLSWQEWSILSSATRRAFQAAGERLRREHAALVATLIANPVAAPVAAGAVSQEDAVAMAAAGALVRAGEAAVG